MIENVGFHSKTVAYENKTEKSNLYSEIIISGKCGSVIILRVVCIYWWVFIFIKSYFSKELLIDSQKTLYQDCYIFEFKNIGLGFSQFQQLPFYQKYPQ